MNAEHNPALAVDSPQEVPADHEKPTDTHDVADLQWDTTSEASMTSPFSEQAKPTTTRVLGTVALMASLVLCGWLYYVTRVDETAHDDWAYVTAAATASADSGSEQLIYRSANGRTIVAPVIQLTSKDMDVETTSAVRKALVQRNLDVADTELQQASQANNSDKSAFPDGEPSLQDKPDLVKPLRDGRARFFHLHMMDCCDEDGDVVQISVNGQPYTTVALTHAGATVTVPLSSGVTMLTVTGVRDGRGGITIRFSTSRGDYFSRPMEVGEEYHIGVAAP